MLAHWSKIGYTGNDIEQVFGFTLDTRQTWIQERLQGRVLEKSIVVIFCCFIRD